MVKKTEDTNHNLLIWIKSGTSLIVGLCLIVGFFAQRFFNEMDDLQRQVHQLTIEISVMKREMEIRNGSKQANLFK